MLVIGRSVTMCLMHADSCAGYVHNVSSAFAFSLTVCDAACEHSNSNGLAICAGGCMGVQHGCEHEECCAASRAHQVPDVEVVCEHARIVLVWGDGAG